MKIRGTIRGQSILLDTLPDLATDQRVVVDITPVEDSTETPEANLEEVSVNGPVQERKRGTRLSDLLSEMGISREELDARIESDPQFEFIREARKHRQKREKQRGGKSDLITQWVREDRDR